MKRGSYVSSALVPSKPQTRRMIFGGFSVVAFPFCRPTPENPETRLNEEGSTAFGLRTAAAAGRKRWAALGGATITRRPAQQARWGRPSGEGFILVVASSAAAHAAASYNERRHEQRLSSSAQMFSRSISVPTIIISR